MANIELHAIDIFCLGADCAAPAKHEACAMISLMTDADFYDIFVKDQKMLRYLYKQIGDILEAQPDLRLRRRARRGRRRARRIPRLTLR